MYVLLEQGSFVSVFCTSGGFLCVYVLTRAGFFCFCVLLDHHQEGSSAAGADLHHAHPLLPQPGPGVLLHARHAGG